MENKNRFWQGVLVGALITVFGGLIVIGASSFILMMGRAALNVEEHVQTVEAGSEAEEEKKALDLAEISQKLMLLKQKVDQDFYFEEDTDSMEEGIYAGMMAGLGDPYSCYYTAEQYEELMVDTQGVYCGIGAMISQNLETNVMTIIRVFEGSPAAEGGLLAGDMISKVDGRDVTQEELDIVVNNYVKGEENTEVTLTVFRPSVNDYLDITMTRKSVEVPTVEHQMLTDDIGYVLITQFEMVTAQQFKDAVKDLESQGMKKLMIDLRSNPGGVVDSAVSIAAYMLPEGDILTTRYKNGQEDVYRTKDKKLRVDSSQEGGFPQYPVLDEDELDIPIAILVNENSASASEILAGAMKDYGRATLVGTTTFGKGIVQNLYPLKDGSAIKMTVAKYFTPSGYDLHEKGIQPDVEVELDAELAARGYYTLEEDNQVQKAIEVLNGEN
ncbi:MAG TPA: S41 family peptidase [Candidatus Lachnoclostridium stercoravium]|uniref:S41 family peptidase n=1 Tax=Candidatus Lachnoclostridium stercoravium TaxID=2838633 RepID=A0A9D2HJD3_9FIRM|nr:S41 family peptidase [Candidatus Lachnoclostridium stercoravium]